MKYYQLCMVARHTAVGTNVQEGNFT